MLTNITSCQWADAAHTQISLIGTHPKFGEIPFSASPDDSEAHGRDIFARAVAQEFGPIAAFVTPVETDEQFNAKVNSQIAALERKELLPRSVREFLLEQPGAQVKGGYAKVKALDDGIAALKATLRA